MNCPSTEAAAIVPAAQRRRKLWAFAFSMSILEKTSSLAGLDAAGAVIFRKRIQRHRLLAVLSQIPRCVVAMEACGGAHHVARFCQAIGQEPRLMSPNYVRPYVKLCSPRHNLTNHEVPIMRKSAA